MIFQNILQNIAIYCIYLNTLASDITLIPRNDTLLYHRTNQISIKVLLLHSYMTYFSGARVCEIVNNCLSLQYVI